MSVSVDDIKKLRELTGVGLTDAKKALIESDGNFDKALEEMRKKGLTKAEKKGDREAREGLVESYVHSGRIGVIVEVNCETDFVANTDNFHAMVEKIAKHIAEANPADMDALNESVLDGKSVAEFVTEAVASIGEKISIRRFERYACEDGLIASYIHMGGKIGVIVELTGGTAEQGKDVAMQVAAAKPSCVDRSSVDQKDLDHEREVLRKQALEEGKPEKIVEKMVDGRINKYYKEVCLIEQPFIKDPDQTVQNILGDVKVRRFTSYQLGEGLEKRNEDFAAEVAAQIK